MTSAMNIVPFEPREPARILVRYEQAKVALRECARIDECIDFANQAEAIASYAKLANDDELRKLADRIQARAIRRCGELLKAIEPAKGTRTDLVELGVGTDTKLTRKRAARAAGLSDRQSNTALRVASIPADVFERQVESESPPTVTKLAKIGTKKKRSSFTELDTRIIAEKTAELAALRAANAEGPAGPIDGLSRVDIELIASKKAMVDARRALMRAATLRDAGVPFSSRHAIARLRDMTRQIVEVLNSFSDGGANDGR